MSASRLIAFLLLGLSVAACTADSGPKEVGGTAVGAVTGGLIGNAIGGSVGNRAAGTVIGAAIGGLFGNRIGAAMDDDDKRRAYAAQMQALETGPSGAPVAWRNPDSGRYGNVVPGPRRHLPAIYPHGLYRRHPAERARHCLPQSRRHLDHAQLTVAVPITLKSSCFA
jgi:surface antigen